MTRPLHLVLTLINQGTEPVSLTALAPQTGWHDAPPHHLAPDSEAICKIAAPEDLAITLCYGNCHVELKVSDGRISIHPGTAKIIHQSLDGHDAEITLGF